MPSKADELPRYLATELKNIQTAIALLAAGHIDVTYSEPSKPRDGDLRYADGTIWNPGSGKGLYRYDVDIANWVLLG